MDDRRRTEGDEEQTATPLAGLGSSGHFFWIDGIRVSPYDCPECLERGDYDCTQCEMFAPSDCSLLKSPHYVTNLRMILDVYRRRPLVADLQRRVQARILDAVTSELRAHGRALHYMTLARMISARYPDLPTTSRRVLITLSSHPDRFEKLTAGVYDLRNH